MKAEYISCTEELPKDGIVVMSKIADEKGERNEQLLKRQGNLWFVPSGDMYVYYRPTHWRSATTDELLKVKNSVNVKTENEGESKSLIAKSRPWDREAI